MRKKIKLISTGLTKDRKKTGTFKTTDKNDRTTTGKLKKKCFDPRAYNEETKKVGKHVMFEEGKI